MPVSVSVPKYRAGKPVLYEVHVDPGDDVVPYVVLKRYNDFLELARRVEEEMGEPVAVPPPPKPALWQAVDYELRRAGLEAMLRALTRVPDFAESLALNSFLELYTRRGAARPHAPAQDWVKATTEVSKLIGEARAATQHAQRAQARQKIVQAKVLIGQLQRQLGGAVGRGETARRQQQLDGYLLTLHNLEQPQDAPRLDAPPPPSAPERVLGETDDTRKHNNSGLMYQQQLTMADQDAEIEALRLAVSRQKELGLEIHSEIVKQTEMLDELDVDVHRVNARLNEARRKTKKLSGR